MNNTALHLSENLELAVRAARAGAAVLQSYAHRRADLLIDKKARNDLVSQADHEAEAAIIDVLNSSANTFGIIAEESGGTTRETATWYIDPLDGTTNFLHGVPHYAVSIALVAHRGAIVNGAPLEHDTPVVAVVYDPNQEEIFSALYNTGAWLNDHRIQCSQTESLAEALLATGLPFRDFSFADNYMPTLHEAIHTSRGVRRFGSAALDLAWTACGRFDGYWEMGLASWDVAAGTLLVREAGGVAEDLHHQEPWPIGGYVYAANKNLAPALHTMAAAHLT
ncbi:inositol monophosphatase family protein [Neopusillimonas maritima]|uniref:Inositol-1-monophosphatase n=1 Tax=Neopusillimonas maritima TaxID=2026239 RepID=A0A3A1YXG6_9BURK|nr:inositol monophosphatase family protein [Neopusillimonas maritima]RIY40757.1 inositol monophosphatase [Neopusillimonas maritima]